MNRSKRQSLVIFLLMMFGMLLGIAAFAVHSISNRHRFRCDAHFKYDWLWLRSTAALFKLRHRALTQVSSWSINFALACEGQMSELW